MLLELLSEMDSATNWTNRCTDLHLDTLLIEDKLRMESRSGVDDSRNKGSLLVSHQRADRSRRESASLYLSILATM